MQKIFGTLVFLLCIQLVIGFDVKAEEKADVQVKKGVLGNGLTYYLVKNESPTIDYHFIQKTGSSVEKIEEKGMAHFVEHITVQCSSKSLKKSNEDFLNRHKIKNIASTYKYKIIYGMMDVNKKDKALNDSCMLIMKDWLCGMNFKEEEIQKVRDVVYEEWLSKAGGINPYHDHMNRIIYNNSVYWGSDNLGDMDVVKNCPIDRFEAFYRKWFNTNNVAIAISGNINIAEVEARVKDLFGPIANDNKAEKFQKVIIPDNEEIYFEATRNERSRSNSVTVFCRIKGAGASGKHEYIKQEFYAELFNRIAAKRMERYQSSAKNRMEGGAINFLDLPIGYKQLCISLVARPGNEKDGLKDIMACYYDLLYHGLTDVEKKELKGYYSTIWERQTADFDYMKVFEDNFLSNQPIYTAHDFNDVRKELCENFKNEDFISYCKKQIAFKNLMVFAQNGAKTNHEFTKESCLSVINDISNANFYKPVLKTVRFDKSSLNQKSKIVKEEMIGDCRLYTFDNGLKVLYRKEKSDYMNMYGVSKGGLSVYEKEDLPVGESMLPYLYLQGTKDNDRMSIEYFKYLNGIQGTLNIDEISESFSSKVHKNYFEKLLQLFYLELNTPKFEQLEGRHEKILVGSIMNNRHKEGQEGRMFKEEVFASNMREMKPWLPEYNMNVTPERLRAFYNKKYNNASDWFYVITGDIPHPKMKALLATYLGALESDGSREEFVNHKPLILEEKEFTDVIETGNMSNVGGTDTSYALFQKLSTKELVVQKILEKIIKIRSEDELRFKRSGLYNVHLSSTYQGAPDACATLTINFGTDKKKVEPYLEYIDGQIKYIAAKEISDKELQNAKKELNAHETNKSAFLTSCMYQYIAGDSIDESTVKYYFDQITPSDILKLAKRFYDEGKVVKFIYK